MKTITVPASLGKNAASFVADALERLKDGGTLLFEKGTYHFYAGDAFRSYFSTLTTMTMGKKAVCFPVIGAHDLTVDGGGSTFIFHQDTLPFIIQDSKNVTLKNFTVDTFLAPYAYALIKELSPDRFVLHIDKKETPYTVENGGLTFDREGVPFSTKDRSFSLFKLCPTGVLFLFAGDTTASDKGLPAVPVMRTDVTEEDGDLVFRYRPDSPDPFRWANVNEYYAILLVGRENCAVGIQDSAGVLLEDLRIRRFGGMGVISTTTTDLTLRRITTAELPISLTADAFHIVHNDGELVLEDCDMHGFLDDLINVHGEYAEVGEVGESTLEAHFLHASYHHFHHLKDGDRARFIDPKTGDIVAEAVVSRQTFDEENPYAFTVKADFLYGKEKVEKGFLLENYRRMPNVTIRGNHFADYPHMRLSGEGKYLIENNVFERTRAGIFIHDLLLYWGESGRVRDMTIRNNVFRDSTLLGGDAVIDVRPAAGNQIVHDGIRVVGNRFCGTYKAAKAISGLKNLVWEDNIEE